LQERPQHRDAEAGKAEKPSSLVEGEIIVGRRERIGGNRFWKELLSDGASYFFFDWCSSDVVHEMLKLFKVPHCPSGASFVENVGVKTHIRKPED
jgi:hypothetical protein